MSCVGCCRLQPGNNLHVPVTHVSSRTFRRVLCQVFFALGGGCINIMNSVLTGNKVSSKTNTPTVWRVVVFVLLALPVY